MNLKGRLGAVITVSVVLFSAVGLFYYAHQFRKDSVQALQVKYREMELQRLEEEKGKQAAAAAKSAAERFDAYTAQIQKRAEALADYPVLRQSQDKPALRKAKQNGFLKMIAGDPSWSAAVLTDDSGALIAATAGGRPLSGTPEFIEASRQRMTVVRLAERKGRDLALQITVPCLSNTGVFLGVLQVETALTSAVLDKTLTPNGLIAVLATPSGRRLTPVALDNFPNNLNILVNIEPQELEAFFAQPGPMFLKADFGASHYLVGAAEIRVSGARLFTLLEVGGLERLVGSEPLTDSFLGDPVILGGLILIFAVGLLLAFVLAGGQNSGVVKLNKALAEILQREEAPLSPLLGEAKDAEWRKLNDYINMLIDRANAAGRTGRPEPAAGDPRAADRLNEEISELRQARDQIVMQNKELLDKLEALSLQNQQLREVAEKARTQASVAEKAQQEEAGQLRIDSIVNMSDDLKATLTVIKNYISSILSSEEGKITDAQQEFLGVVINKSARLERQINDLLDLSHLESEAAQMFMVPTDLSAMLQDVILNAQPQADAKQIKLLLNAPSSLSKIMINGDRLGQVLINLVQYALRVTPVGGEVRIEVGEEAKNQTVRIVDGGAPLTPDQAAVMFTHFHGLDSRGGSSLAGSGLRFAIVHEIVKAHRGVIAVRVAAVGNEIAISLPLIGESTSASTQSGVAAAEVSVPATSENEAFFDLSAFMQDTPPEAANTPVASGNEDLDELLKNIEDVNEPKES